MRGATAVKIVGIEVYPLTGATVDGGWPQGHEPRENLHTLLVVRTDAGLAGCGSCFTSGKLVAGAVELLWPLLKGESAVEPERVSETLRQASFWQGRGGSVEHAISGIDIALWDLLGKACGQNCSLPPASTISSTPSPTAFRASETSSRSKARSRRPNGLQPILIALNPRPTTLSSVRQSGPGSSKRIDPYGFTEVR